MLNGGELFEQTLEWFRVHYSDYHFFVERDVVWTLQMHLSRLVASTRSPYHVFNDYPIIPGTRRSLSADLVLVEQHTNRIEVAAEFKYEPSHRRKDILPSKLPVVFWGDDGVGKDVKRVHEFVRLGKVQTAYAVFVDEGGAFHHRQPHPGSRWISWENGVWVLYSRVAALPLPP